MTGAEKLQPEVGRHRWAVIAAYTNWQLVLKVRIIYHNHISILNLGGCQGDVTAKDSLHHEKAFPAWSNHTDTLIHPQTM